MPGQIGNQDIAGYPSRAGLVGSPIPRGSIPLPPSMWEISVIIAVAGVAFVVGYGVGWYRCLKRSLDILDAVAAELKEDA